MNWPKVREMCSYGLEPNSNLCAVPLAEVDGDADPTPDELEQEELEAYFQEYEAMKDFQDIPPEMFELDDDDVLDDRSMDMS